MTSNSKKVRIGIFGHYGNRNLGDESIIEAVIKNIRSTMPGSDIVCLSIDPFDSRERYQVDAFPIRYRADYFRGNNGKVSAQGLATKDTSPPPASQPRTGLKQRLKSTPVLGHLLKSAARTVSGMEQLKQEIAFLSKAKAYVEDLDLLLVTGSNQFLDNFGGPWGFPYTLLKWTLLAKSTNTKVAFISIGAGPLDKQLSFRFLKWTLSRADYVSVRDQGSRALIHSRIGIQPEVVPDIAHSLQAERPARENLAPGNLLTVAVNPMPVYDSRYWYEADDEKFNAYVDKLSELCATILDDGHILELFSTQNKDENVIDDIMKQLQTHPHFHDWADRIRIARNSQVSQLMTTLERADIVVATRFHGTVLPLQLGKPVLGVCYYRKAAELLDDVGLSEYWVDLDNFDAQTLIAKYRSLLDNREAKSLELAQHMLRYTEKLNIQYQTIKDLLHTPESANVSDMNQEQRW